MLDPPLLGPNEVVAVAVTFQKVKKHLQIGTSFWQNAVDDVVKKKAFLAYPPRLTKFVCALRDKTSTAWSQGKVAV